MKNLCKSLVKFVKVFLWFFFETIFFLYAKKRLILLKALSQRVHKSMHNVYKDA